MFAFLKKKPRLVLGIDISSTAVKMLAISNINGQYCVEGYGRSSLLQSPHDADVIKKLHSSAHFTSKQAVLAVPDSYIINKIIQISAHVQEKDLEEWVLMEAEKYIPYPLDEVHLDFNILGTSSLNPAQMDVRVVASRAEHVSLRVDVIRRAGLAVRAVDVESFAIERVVDLWKMDVPSCGRHVALFDIDESYTRCFVFEGEHVIFFRENVCSSGHPADMSEQILLNIKQALQFFFGSIGQLILAGRMARSQDLAPFLHAHLRIPIHIANPFIGMRFATNELRCRIEQDAPMLMVACGLALRR